MIMAAKPDASPQTERDFIPAQAPAARQTPAQTAAGSPPSTATLLNGVRGAERAASATAGATASGAACRNLSGVRCRRTVRARPWP
jgi:hypothetical protein